MSIRECGGQCPGHRGVRLPSGACGQYACEMLSGWSGTLVADGYAGYRALFRDGQEGAPPAAPGICEAGCMAHVRRKFMELYRMNGSPGAKEHKR